MLQRASDEVSENVFSRFVILLFAVVGLVMVGGLSIPLMIPEYPLMKAYLANPPVIKHALFILIMYLLWNVPFLIGLLILTSDQPMTEYISEKPIWLYVFIPPVVLIGCTEFVYWLIPV